jgi:hypothetical protein
MFWAISVYLQTVLDIYYGALYYFLIAYICVITLSTAKKERTERRERERRKGRKERTNGIKVGRTNEMHLGKVCGRKEGIRK